MKKIALLLSAIMMFAALAGCNKNKEIVQDNIPMSDVKDIVEDETKNEVVMSDVSEGDLSDKIKKINSQATIQQSVNPGMQMLKVELPVDESKLPNEFFKQVEKIVKDCKLSENTDFDYFYFSTSKDGAVQIAASFKRENDVFALDAVTGVGEEYKDAADRAAKISSIFKKAE